MKDVSIDMDSKTDLEDIFSRKEAQLSSVSLFLCVCVPSFKSKVIFFYN